MLQYSIIVAAICVVSFSNAFLSSYPENYLYTLRNGAGNVCLVLRANISFSFNYNVTGGNKTVQVTVPVPEVNATGSCGKNTDVVDLSWLVDSSSYSLSLTVTKDDKRYNLTEANFTYYYYTTAGYMNGTSHNGNLSEFSTKLGQNYKCDDLKNISMNGGVTMSMRNFRIQAFMNSSSSDFTGSVNDCDPIKPSSSALVPIAIGAALAGMIVLVLVGYFIGRRNTSGNYTAMES